MGIFGRYGAECRRAVPTIRIRLRPQELPRPRYFAAFQAMDFLLLKKMKARSWYSGQVTYYASSVCGLRHLLFQKSALPLSTPYLILA